MVECDIVWPFRIPTNHEWPPRSWFIEEFVKDVYQGCLSILIYNQVYGVVIYVSVAGVQASVKKKKIEYRLSKPFPAIFIL